MIFLPVAYPPPNVDRFIGKQNVSRIADDPNWKWSFVSVDDVTVERRAL
jgi:hypothetical protein